MANKQPVNVVDLESVATSEINADAVAATRAKARATVDRAQNLVLRDDPEAKAAFLATFTPQEEKAIMRKIDKRFFVLIGLMYMIKQIDQTNISSIKVLQAKQPSNILVELNMTADAYNWVSSIYFIGYIIFETPSNLLLKRFGPHIWQSRIFLCWGIITACTGAVQSRQSLYACRFLLGMFECGMFPGVMAQLQSWYRTEEIGRPTMWYFVISQANTIVGSLLCYGISYMDGVRGISAWRWVFILEGTITIFFAGILFWLLPDYPKSPRSNRFLTEREQEFIETRLPENAPRTDDPWFSKKEVLVALKRPSTWSFSITQLLVNIGNQALIFYLPTVTTSLGFVGLPRNQLLNIAPAVAAILLIVFTANFIRAAIVPRPLVIMAIMAGMIVIFILFFTVSNRAGVYIACILGTAFTQTFFVPFWAWRSSTLSGSTGAAFSLGFQNCIGQVGGVIGPQIFRQKWAYNRYKNSFAIAAACTITGAGTAAWTWWLTRNVELDVLRIARLRRKAEKEGKIFTEDDVQVFEERRYHSMFRLGDQDGQVTGRVAQSVV